IFTTMVNDENATHRGPSSNTRNGGRVPAVRFADSVLGGSFSPHHSRGQAQPRKAMRKVLASKQVAAHNDDDDDFVAPKRRPVAEDGGDAQERPRVQKRRAVAEDGGDAQERPRVQKRRPVAEDGGDPQERSRAPLQGHGGTGRPQADKIKQPQANCARCSPSLFHKFMDMGLTDDLRKRIEDMGFKGLVNLAPTSLDSRDFLCWSPKHRERPS
ncbi:hypothetical protein EJB05_14513, partial [Eragrostis curvula]